uniref:RxLR effector protein n=1 Tax=Phytophthora pistaciae TaxID=174576 RepID=A0A3G3MDH5_9STRA|nr:Avh226 protein [Phytophthora pistaciae]
MRVCYALLVAAATLIATGNTVDASATAQVVSPLAVLANAGVRAVDADKRLLRSRQTEEEEEDSDDTEEEDESEERGLNVGVVDDAFANLRSALRSDDDAVAGLLPTSTLTMANNGNHDMQRQLFLQWLNAKPEVRQKAIATILRNRGDDDFRTLLAAWMHSGERRTRSVGFHGSNYAVDELLPRLLVKKAGAGDPYAQAVLFSKWMAAPSETRDTALKILHESAQGTRGYETLNAAWISYLRQHLTTYS